MLNNFQLSEYQWFTFIILDQGRTNLHFQVGHLSQLFCNLKPGTVLIIIQVPNSIKSNINISKKILDLTSSKAINDNFRRQKLIILLFLPKIRDAQNTKIHYDYYAALLEDNFWHLGKKLGVLRNKSKKSIPKFEECSLKFLSPHIQFNSDIGAQLNGLKQKLDNPITLIGAGALGSQFFNNLIRSGFKNLKIIDYDILLPHNLARHLLSTKHVGFNKAISLEEYGNELLNSKTIKGVNENILHPKDQTALIKILEDSKLILDISASIPVARELASKNINSRCISVFLNPKGSDLIFLAEDENRTIRLDSIEMQYYRFLISKNLTAHLETPEDQIRYSNSCRSISSRISQDFLSIHSGIASRATKQLLKDTRPFANIWSIDMDSLEIKNFHIDIHKTITIKKYEWELIIDDFVLDKIYSARTNKLPKETGGILIGGYDMLRKKIYIIDTILSPKDSEEYPYAYIRGIEGVKDNLEIIQKISAGNIEYVGEWHSHPKNCSLEPSMDDKKLFSWIENHMALNSRPALILIIGDGCFNLLVNCI